MYKCFFKNKINKITGTPSTAVKIKKYEYPISLTSVPEYPPMILGAKTIIDVNKANWDAVKSLFVIELKKATNATEAIPPDKLSAVITNIRKNGWGSILAKKANSRLLLEDKTAPINKTM